MVRKDSNEIMTILKRFRPPSVPIVGRGSRLFLTKYGIIWPKAAVKGEPISLLNFFSLRCFEFSIYRFEIENRKQRLNYLEKSDSSD